MEQQNKPKECEHLWRPNGVAVIEVDFNWEKRQVAVSSIFCDKCGLIRKDN
jgi:hypothetical protein